MKIVKWVTGLDYSQSPAKLLYPAFEEKLAGRPRDEVEQAWREAEDIVKECKGAGQEEPRPHVGAVQERRRRVHVDGR